jgi:hypothetical protein
MAENLILPVPERLTAVYLVPAVLDCVEATDRAKAALPIWVPDPVGTVARKMIEVGAVRVACLSSSALPAVPAELQEHLGVAPELVQIVTAAHDYVSFTATWPPGWPPVHEASARACAAALAAALGVPLVDAYIPRVLAPKPAIGALPDAASKLDLSDWVLVVQSAGHQGLWMTTKGMGRFGLPELQVSNVPPQYGTPWSSLLRGISAVLLDLWLDALRTRDGAAFAEIPGTFDVAEADVASAYNADSQGGGHVKVQLAFDPATNDGMDSFLTIRPPDDYPASAGEYLTHACREVFGENGRQVRYLPPTDSMEQAFGTARAALPSIRTRFLGGDLPLSARLMVKHAVNAAGGTEYVWAYVNSWADPATVLGSSAADAVSDPQVRAGRPIVIDVAAVVDWAVWVDGQGIIEGGATNTLAVRGDNTRQ